MINWSDADDRRNIIFRAVGSADNRTGYVFGMHLNFDPLMDANLIERDAISSGDYEVKPAYRQYARLWLRQDYIDAIKKARAQRSSTYVGTLKESIAATYQDADNRDDIEVFENLNEALALPKDGMQVR